MNRRISVVLATSMLTALAAAQHEPRAWQHHDGVSVAASPRSVARVNADGAALVEAGIDTDQPANLQLRYLGNRRTGHRAPVTARPQVQSRGDTTRLLHEGVVETYRLTELGFEQSFVVDQRPAGHGDWLFDIEVTGNVHAPKQAPRHGAIEFCDDDGRAIRYGEAFAFDRTGLRVDVQTAFDGEGRLQLLVPAAFVADATFPIVVDPVVTPVFLPADTFFNDSLPAIAHDLETDRYLVVWRRTYSATQAGILGKLFTRTGAFASAEFAIALGDEDVGPPAVAPCTLFSPNAFLVTWHEDGQILGRLHSTSFGSPLADEFVISTPAAGETDRQPTVSGPGTGTMMVAWERVAPGELFADRILLNHLFWTDTAQPQNVSTGAEQILEQVTIGNVRNVRLADSDVRTVVGGSNWYANRAVWQRFYETPAPGDADIRSASFRIQAPFGFAFLDPTGTVAGGGDIGPSETEPDIGVRATSHDSDADVQYLIAWQDDSDVLAHMMDLDGATGALITIDDTAGFQGDPAVGAGFCEFSVGYIDLDSTIEFNSDVRAARVLLDGTVAVTERLIDDPGPQAQFGLDTCSRQIHDQPGDEFNRVLFAWTGQTGTGAGINDVRAAFFEPVDSSETNFGVPCPGPLGELPMISTAYGPAYAGNDDYEFRVDGAPALSIAVLVVSDQFTSTPIPGAPGCTLYAGLPLVTILPTITDAAGDGFVKVPMPCSIPSGAALAFQWAIYSPTANAFGWIVSDDIDVSWSHF